MINVESYVENNRGIDFFPNDNTIKDNCLPKLLKHRNYFVEALYLQGADCMTSFNPD